MVLQAVLDARLTPGDIIVEGCAKGADEAAEWAGSIVGVRVEHYPAYWDQHGKFAGPLRNMRMLNSAPDEVWAFHDYLANSRGTAHMIRLAKTRGIKVKVFTHVQPKGGEV